MQLRAWTTGVAERRLSGLLVVRVPTGLNRQGSGPEECAFGIVSKAEVGARSEGLGTAFLYARREV